MNSKTETNTKLGGIAITILIISAIVILFSFLAPSIFVQENQSGIDFSETGQIGDTIGGIMNPFIALSGVLLTFLAFFIQFKANKLQQELFRLELREQRGQFHKTQFENQFYEMLRLHKENVNELHIKSNINPQLNRGVEDNASGRSVFDLYIKEFELCFVSAKYSFPGKKHKVLVNEAYGAFFHGLNTKIIEKHDYYKLLSAMAHNHAVHNYSSLNRVVKDLIQIDWDKELYYPLFKGYSSQLAHYYRHLFQTVKFVVNQSQYLISYEEKRKYLRILRAQLSNQEQVMLFYNWLSKFGSQWENETNKFFTDFRMIHNIYQDLILKDIKLDELFEINGNYLKEENREFDPLFEFQDWR